MPARSDRELRSSVRSIPAAEWAWLCAAILAGSWLRLAFPTRMAVEHFDEGVYASNVLFGAESNFQYPGREFFAPPLLPTIIEWLHIGWSVTGLATPGWLPMVPALVCGIATIPSLWWIARSWFSPNAGIAAAWLIALCEFHAAYSRTALTDVPLTFFLLWAVYWFARALAAPGSPGIAIPGSLRSAIVAGLFTAAAWWTKYNGWLPIAIAVTATVLCLLLTRAPRAAWTRSAAICALGAITAGVLWLPVLWDCQDIGGYSAVAANHRGYVEGRSAWMKNAYQQFDQHGGAYAGWATLVGIAGPTLVAIAIRARGAISDSGATRPGSRMMGLGINVAIMAVHPGSWFPIVIGTAIVCSALALGRGVRDRGNELALHAALGLVWVGSLLVVTPLYHPYPRLTLPLVVGCVLAGSIFWRRGWVDFVSPGKQRTWWLGPSMALALSLGVLAVRGSIAWEDRSGYRSAAAAFAAQPAVQFNDDSLVYAVVEPGFFYNLRTAGLPGVIVGDFRFLGNPVPNAQVFVAEGPLIGGSTPDSKSAWDAVRNQFTRVGEFDGAPPSSLVRLDQDANFAHQIGNSKGTARYALYRWNGPAAER